MPIFETADGKWRDVSDSHAAAYAKDHPDYKVIEETPENYIRYDSYDAWKARDNASGQQQDQKKGRKKDQSPQGIQPQPQQQPAQEDTGPDGTQLRIPQMPKLRLPEEPKQPDSVPLTDQEKAEYSMKANRALQGAGNAARGLYRKMDNVAEYNSRGGAGTPVESDPITDSNGVAHRTWLTPIGNRYLDPNDAMMETKLYMRPTPDMTASAQLRRVQQQREDLVRKRAERLQELKRNATAQLRAESGNDKGYLGLMGGSSLAYMEGQAFPNDEQVRAYDVSIKQLDDAITELKAQRRRDDGTRNWGKFWHSAWDQVSDLDKWTFGITELSDMAVLLGADRLKDGTPEGEAAYNSLMRSVKTSQDVQAQFGGNANFWERAGATTGAMLPFMADFAAMGGTLESVSVLGKAAGRLAGKMGTNAAGRVMGWTVKALGTTVDDIAKGAIMANTIQLGHTAADAVGRKLGDVVQNPDGSLSFDNSRSWASAIWQAEGNQTIENASEMFGTHLPASSEVIGKIAKTFGAKRIGAVLASADAAGVGAAFGTANRWLERLGVSGTIGEISEEYVGQIEKTILGIEDAYQYNPDGSRTNLLWTKQFHGDIWGGMFLSMGLMNAPRLGMTGAAYASMRHNVSRADTKCGAVFGDEWADIRNRIDNTTNDDIGALIDEIDNDASLPDNKRLAELDYIAQSLMFRGYNLASLAASRTGEQTPQVPGAQVAGRQQTESWIDGYNAAGPEEMNGIKTAYELQRQKFSDTFNEEYADADEGQLSDGLMQCIDMARSAQTDAERDLYMDRATTIADYLNARQAYEGMMQGVRDDLDLKVLQSDQLVDSQSNQQTGQIQTATTRMGEAVHVVGGNLSLREDGTIDAQNSDESVVIRHDGGKLEMVSPDYLAKADAPVDAQTVKAQAAEQIRQQYATEAAARIDGTVTSFNPGDAYTLTDDQGNQIQITLADNGTGTADNGDGTVMATDQNGQQMRLTKEMIQSAADQANAARAQQAEDERQSQIRQQNGGQGQEQAEQQPAPEVQQATPQQEAPQQPQSALEQIPSDEQGNPDFEKAPSPEIAYDAISEMADGDTDTTQAVIEQTVAEKERELDKAKKAKSAGGATIAEKIAAETGRKSAIADAQHSLDFWKGLAGMRQRRADAEKTRLAEEEKARKEAEAQRKAAEEAAAKKAQEEVEKAAEEAAEAQRKAIEDERKKQQEEKPRRGQRQIGSVLKKAKEAADAITEIDGDESLSTIRRNAKREEQYLAIADQVARFDANVAAGAEATDEEKAVIDGYRQQLTDAGYEIVTHVGDEYNSGMRCRAQFIPDENAPAGSKKITGIIKPQVNKNGVMVQSAEIFVTQGPEVEGETPRRQTALAKLREKNQQPSVGEQVRQAESETDPNPTPAQAEAGNYRKGHVTIGDFDISIENPAGSVRRGVDANGKEWSTEMKNTYGYILGHYDTDGDHIDVFLGNDLDYWDGHRVFVVDQYNPDGTFDEHKCMIGFNDAADAMRAYLDNYEKDWEKGRRIEISSIPASDFGKWVESSGRKTKPFAEYVNAGIEGTQSAEEVKKEPKSGGMHMVDLMGVLTDLKEKGEAKFSDHYVGEEKKEEKGEPYSAVLSRPYKVDPTEQNDFKKFGGIYKSVEKDIKDLAGHLIDDLGVRDLQSEYGENSGINVRQHGIAADIGDIVVRKKGKEYDEVGVSMHFGNDKDGNVGLGYAAVSVVHHDSPIGPSDITVWYTVDLKDGMTYGQFLNIIRKAIDDSKPGENVRATIDADGNLTNVKADNEAKSKGMSPLFPSAYKVDPTIEDSKARYKEVAKKLAADMKPIAELIAEHLNVKDLQKENKDLVTIDNQGDIPLRIRARILTGIEGERRDDVLVDFLFTNDDEGNMKIQAASVAGGYVIPYKVAAIYNSFDIQDPEKLDENGLLFAVEHAWARSIPGDRIEYGKLSSDGRVLEVHEKDRSEEQGKEPAPNKEETKPAETETKAAEPENAGYTITPTKYTTKKGKDLDMHVVRFDKELSKEEAKEAGSLARRMKGWTDYKGGYWLRSDETAREFARQMTERTGTEEGKTETPESIIDTADRIAEEERNRRNAEKGLPENAKKLGMPVRLEEGDTVYIPVVAFDKDGKPNGREYRSYTVAGMSDGRYVLRREDERDSKMYDVELVAHDSWYIHNDKPAAPKETETDKEPVLRSRPRPLDEEDQDRVVNSILRPSLRKAVKHLIKDLGLPTGIDADSCVSVDYEKLRTRLEIPAGDSDLLVIDFSLNLNGGMMGGDVHVEDNKRKGHPMGLVGNISYRELRDNAKRAIDLFRKEREHETKGKGKGKDELDTPIFDRYGDANTKFKDIEYRIKGDLQGKVNEIARDLGLYVSWNDLLDNTETIPDEKYVIMRLPVGEGDRLVLEFDFDRSAKGFEQIGGQIYVRNQDRTRKMSTPLALDGGINYGTLRAFVESEVNGYRKVPKKAAGEELSFTQEETGKKGQKALFPDTAKELYSDKQPWLEKAMTKDATAIAKKLIKDLNVTDSQWREQPEVTVSDKCTRVKLSIPLHNYVSLEVRFGFGIDDGGFARLENASVVLDNAYGRLGQYEIAAASDVDGLDYGGILDAVRGDVQRYAPEGLKENSDRYRPENKGKGPDFTAEDKKKITDYPKIVVAGVPKAGENVVTRKKTETETEAKPKPNYIVSDEKMAEYKARLKARLNGQLNVGFDPDLFSIGAMLALGHIERGVRKFADYARKMIEDIGDAIRPYLKSFYNGARDMPEAADFADEMTPYDEVAAFDTANFDRKTPSVTAAADNYAAEDRINKEAEKAKKDAESVDNGKYYVNLPSENDNKNSDENGLKGTVRNDEPGSAGMRDGQRRPVDAGRLGDGSGQEGRGSDRGGEEGGQAQRGADSAGGLRHDGRLKNSKNSRNFRLGRGEDNSPKSVDARITANIKAIELAQKIISERRVATPEEMAVLSRFSGWGGLGKLLNDKELSERVRELVGDESFRSIQMAGNSSYFTPANVVDAMWDIARQMGFKGGNILEGSAGIGNMLAHMPEDISANSDIQAVEIDDTTGTILRLLYPDAQVDIQGFEKTKIANGSVDLAITNVPFVTGLHVFDETGDNKLAKKFHDIHDFCIAKNVRKLRPGGIGIFISSAATLDRSAALRGWITGEGDCDFIGAFRLNNKTFGGTDATSDIIVVRRRIDGVKSANAVDLSDAEIARRADGKPLMYNRYFQEHPENMGGEMHFAFEKGDTSYRPDSIGLYREPGKDQDRLLSDFVRSIREEEQAKPVEEGGSAFVKDVSAGERKQGEMYVKDGRLVVADVGGYFPLEVNANKIRGHTKVECFNAYAAVKTARDEVLKYQTENEDDKGLEPLLKKLNKAFDDFTETYGHFVRNGQLAFLRNDVDYPSVAALETAKETINKKTFEKEIRYKKGDVFSGRVVGKAKAAKPESVKDGVLMSFANYGKIDLKYIAGQLGVDEEAVRKEILDGNLGFENPASLEIEPPFVYLSGNVREKLMEARENNADGKYDGNVKALEKVIPIDIQPQDIEVQLGSTWIDPEVYKAYIKERTGVDIKEVVNAGGRWRFNGIGFEKTELNKKGGVYSKSVDKWTYLTDIIMAAMGLTKIEVKKTVDKETTRDEQAERLANQKVDEEKNEFRKWFMNRIQADPDFASNVQRVYNDKFNSYVRTVIPNEYAPRQLPGMSDKVTLKPHQARAVALAMTKSLILAHEVGAGKTYTLIAIAMELRRLGRAKKPMIAVQPATLEQFVTSAKTLYPNAKILAYDGAKFNGAEGRKRFYSLIKYNDWDMIIVPHSTFDFIPDSDERQIEFIRQKIREKQEAMERIQDERQRARIETQIDNLNDTLNGIGGTGQEGTAGRVSSSMTPSSVRQKKGGISRQNAETKAKNMLDRKVDDVENFDQMEIDALLIDEAHNYKKLGGETALAQSVKGVDLGYSQRSQGLYLKTRAVMEKNNGRNVIFATGTPISNTAAEVWNFMRYLMPEEALDEYNMRYFDDFVNNFGNIDKDFEYATSGNLKETTRFRGYGNLPELARLWTSVADIVLNRDLVKDNVEDKRPAVEGGRPKDVFLPQNDSLMAVMDYVKKCFDWYDNLTPMERYKNKTMPGKWYNMAQGAAVDARLVWSGARDEESSKTNEAVRLTLADLKETEKYNGTVAIFCDRIQNPKTGFNLFEDIKAKLVKGGVPEDQIAIIKSGMSNKEKIFEKVNSGEIRVVMGSTFTLGTGVNIQERLHTLIHVDAPNRPMDYTQRNGRIHRQGNLHKDMGIPIRIVRLGIEDTLDKTAYQRLEFKAAFIDSLMNVEPLLTNNGKAVRVLNAEADELQNFGDTKANLSGNQYAILQSRAKKKVNALLMDSERHKLRQSYVKDTIPKKEREIKRLGDMIAANEKAEKETRERFPDGTAREITIMGNKAAIGSDLSELYTEHNKKILQASRDLLRESWKSDRTETDDIDVDGLKFTVTTKIKKEYRYGTFGVETAAKRDMSYSCPALGLKDVPVKSGLIRVAVDDILQNIVTGRNFEENARNAKESVEETKKEIALLKDEVGKPFPKEDELIQAESDLEEYTQKMNEEQKEIDAREAARRGGGHSLPTDIQGLNVDFEDNVLRREGPATAPAHDNTAIGVMAARARTIARSLHLDDVRIVRSTESLPESLMNARGYFDDRTGQITVIVPNNEDAADIERTVMHEGVAHYGLRMMLGDGFSDFLRHTYEDADESVRRRIAESAAAKGWDFGKATEEYLATLAESTDFRKEGRAWSRIRGFFRDALRRIGIGGGRITDEDLRYMLWKSYHRLDGGLVDRANDIAFRNRLGLLTRERGGRTITEYRQALARDRYEKRLKTSRFQSIEAWQDSMRSLMEAMQAIAGKKGMYIEDFEGYENPYLGENRLSSVNRAEADAFSRLVFQPMLDEVARLARNDAERDELTDYMMAKHGLERNRHMRGQAVQKEFDEITRDWPKVPAEPELGDEELIDARSQLRRDLEEKYAGYDYAGLTALTGESDATEAEYAARDIVSGYEDGHDTKALWEKVNAVNKGILSKQLETGMISRELHDRIAGMYKFYIPLRGFDESVGEDSYAYLNHPDSAFNSPIRRAEGRRSKADDPFANMQQMAESAITQGNRNRLVKQKFLNFAMNHPSDLVSISDLWIRHDDATDEWVPVFPDLRPEDDAETVAGKLAEFEERMKKLKAEDPDNYRHGRDAVGMPYRIVSSRDAREHQVIVKRDGRDYVLTINGNPRAAQAVNGQTNPDNDRSSFVGVLTDKVDSANRYLSAVSTTYNPNFMASNFSRDMIYVNSMVWVKERPAYALRYHQNILKCNPFQMGMLLHRYQQNILDMNDPLERNFREFMLNGGETGFTSARTLEEHRKDVDREIRKAQGRVPARRAADLTKETVEDVNRSVELVGRFAAFVTSRQFGRSVDRAIWDAKEISVNFNKKGSGEKFMNAAGQTRIGRIAAGTSGGGRHLYIFWNAAVQGLTNMGRQAVRHPAKFWACQAALFGLGTTIAALGAMIRGGDGDDGRNNYLNLPDYTRRDNILIPIGHGFMALPLSQEYRVAYGLGEILGSLMGGAKMSAAEVTDAVLAQMSQALPLDLMEGDASLKNLLPSAIKPVVDVFANTSWTGMPIYNGKDYMKDMPNWTKAYSNTNRQLLNLAATLNEATGGDNLTKGAVDINPAVMEYLLNSYLGGPITVTNQLAKTGEWIAGKRDFDPQIVPILNRLYKAGDERTEYRDLNRRYYEIADEARNTARRLRGYEKLADRDILGYAERLDFLYDSPESERNEIVKSVATDLKTLSAALAAAEQAGDREEARELRAEMADIKRDVVEAAEETREDRTERRQRRRERREALREAGWRPGVNR